MILPRDIPSVLTHLHFAKWLAWISICCVVVGQRCHRIASLRRLADWKFILRHWAESKWVSTLVYCLNCIQAKLRSDNLCIKNLIFWLGCGIIIIACQSHMDGFPSGQRGQTVNLLRHASMVRIHLHPVSCEGYAAVAEQADAQDLKSCGTNLPCRFDSGLRHLEILWRKERTLLEFYFWKRSFFIKLYIIFLSIFENNRL